MVYKEDKINNSTKATTSNIKTAGTDKSVEHNDNTIESDKKIENIGEDAQQMYDIPVEANSQGILSTSFELPVFYYKKLHQHHFENLNEIKSKTKTDIVIPRNEKTDRLIISGADEGSIKQALNEIHCILGQIRNMAMALQFIAIRLTSDEIVTNFEKFKNELLAEDSFRGMHESIFQKPLRLHLTIDIFVLLNEREKKEAVQALEDYKESVLKPMIEKSGPLKIHVAGIECMNNDYENVHILYAKAKIVDETDEMTLQTLANGLSVHFYERGLLKKHQENIKLHMTLINTKYRTEPGSPRRRWVKRKSIDARKIMEKYKDYEFGQCDLTSIHIANISTLGKDGFYEVLGSVEL
uniref:Activating signal cointegrator 1 complex subunit 1-like isoform X2 n=1 Tax=Diabrotica virgifera virgifera TaxID=50390 RepID=A0A6P7G360_DIAVI